MSDWLVMTQSEMVDLLYRLNDELVDETVAPDRRQDISGLIAFFMDELRVRAGAESYALFAQASEPIDKRMMN